MKRPGRLILAFILTASVFGVSLASGAQAPMFTMQVLSFPAALPPPINRLEVRQAIAYALDRQAIAALLPPAVPAVGINHPMLPGYNPQVRGYPHDPDKAKELLAQASWSGDTLLTVYVPSNRVSPAWNGIKIRENLLAAGIKAQIDSYPLNTLGQLVTATNGFAYLVGWLANPSGSHLSVGIARASNLGPVDVIERYDQTTDQATKEKIAQDLEQLLLDRALIIPLFFQN